jgi:WD40 repeat protein
MPDRELMEDGMHYFDIQLVEEFSGGRSARITTTDAAGRRKQVLGTIELPWWPPARGGLVPGGKYFHIATQIYDRETLKLVAGRRFSDHSISLMRFSGDGGRYMVITSEQDQGKTVIGSDSISDRFAYDAGPPSVHTVRVQETLSGKTVAAFTPNGSARDGAVFSPDGKHLAVINGDGTIEVWPLP